MDSPKCRILYAEDNEDTCFLISTMLGQANIEVKCAMSASEALQLAKTEHFDLYMLDTIFPDGDGVELCKQLRVLDGHTPVVFYSGAAYDTDKRRALDAGAQAYLIKPDFEGVVETVSRLGCEETTVMQPTFLR
ncbi:MAG: response regulator [Pyrinomonadaceae bacterium]|nr:response regulator [Pyrinomonadaceae bacterium]